MNQFSLFHKYSIAQYFITVINKYNYLSIIQSMQEILDEIPSMICIGSNSARMLCVSETCNENAFLCLKEQCECEAKHPNCPTYRVKVLVEQIRSKRQEKNVQVVQACQTLKNILDTAVDKLSKDKEQIGDQMELYGLNQHQAFVYKVMKDQRLSETNGACNLKALEVINQKAQLNLTEQNVKRYWTKFNGDFHKIFDGFKLLLKKKYIKLESKITDQIEIIQGFFERPIYQFKLLYRASENSFQVSTFHTKCDGIPNTLILAKTQFGKIIGGYTPIKWNCSSAYMNDIGKEGSTFLFSISLNQKYDVLNHSYTTYGNNSYGPTFGGGHDFYIGNNSSTTDNSCYFNFPYSFNNGKYVNGQSAYTAFCGSTNGNYYARVDEWEVFQIEFM